MQTVEEKHKLMLDTIQEIYPKYQKSRVIKKLEEMNIISNERNLFTICHQTDEPATLGSTAPPKLSTVDVSTISDDTIDTELKKIEKAILDSADCLKVIENLEYEYSYKYSTLLELNEYPDEKIKALIAHGQIFDSSSTDFSDDHCSYFSELDIIKPTYKELDSNVSILKFNEIITGYLPISENNKRTIKYPMLVLFFKDINVLEIRFGSIRSYLRNNDEYFYLKQVEKLINWLDRFLTIDLTPFNLSPIVDFISRKDSKEVDVAAQAMNMKSGSKAILDTGENDMPVLPLLGELKELMRANEDLFEANNETQAIKEKLTNFIFETEETSDLPWISLRWRHQTKSKVIKVKFSFDFKGQVYDLLQYYGNNAEMGEMNNVTKYLIENKREYENEDTESPEEGEVS